MKRNCCRASAGLVAAFLLQVALRGEVDTLPPTLVALQFEPTTVDTTAGPQQVTVRLRLKDDQSGFVPRTGCELTLMSPSGRQYLHVYASLHESQGGVDCELIGTGTTPKGAENGTWTLVELAVPDAAGNRLTLRPADLVRLGLNPLLQVSGPEDLEGPQVMELTFSPTVVDTTAANAEIKVRLRIRDIGFGIDTNTSPCSFNFTPPSLLTGLWLSFEPFLTSRITGDEFDGTYETSLVVPKGSEPGLWLPSDLWCHDRAGNRGAPLCVGEACAPGFTVVNQGEFAPLDLVDFRLRQTEVDTSLAAASLEVEVTVRDSLDSQGPVNFRFVSPSGRQYASSTPTPPFVSGMYRVEFPERAEPGDWVVEHLWTASGSSRYLRLTAAQLAARGFDTVVQVSTAPILHAANSTGVLLLWWETDQTGFVVETTSVLAPAVWEPVPGVVTRVSGAWVTAVTGGGAGQYFRLRQGP